LIRRQGRLRSDTQPARSSQLTISSLDDQWEADGVAREKASQPVRLCQLRDLLAAVLQEPASTAFADPGEPGKQAS
jgi:hypothetical protein